MLDILAAGEEWPWGPPRQVVTQATRRPWASHPLLVPPQPNDASCTPQSTHGSPFESPMRKFHRWYAPDKCAGLGGSTTARGRGLSNICGPVAAIFVSTPENADFRLTCVVGTGCPTHCRTDQASACMWTIELGSSNSLKTGKCMTHWRHIASIKNLHCEAGVSSRHSLQS